MCFKALCGHVYFAWRANIKRSLTKQTSRLWPGYVIMLSYELWDVIPHKYAIEQKVWMNDLIKQKYTGYYYLSMP